MTEKYRELVEADAALVLHIAETSDLAALSDLSSLPPTELATIRDAAESVVLELLNYPLSANGSRMVVRQDYTETIISSVRADRVRLSRKPASVTSLTIGAKTVLPADYKVETASGRVLLQSGFAAADCEIIVAYAGGWVAPAQTGIAGPPLPPAIIEAVIRASQLIQSARDRDDLSLRTHSMDLPGAGSFDWAYNSTARTIQAEVSPLLAGYTFITV